MIKKILSPLALGAALTLAGGSYALADSQYGQGTGTITAQANVKLSVTVPKLILLRVGGSTTTPDTVSWTTAFSIPAAPTAAVDGNNTAVNWNGALPTATVTPTNDTLTVYAWTNANTGSINCAVPSMTPAGGPANADFTVTVTGTLPHPGANLGTCTSTNFGSNTIATGTWKYVLGGTAANWKAGTYTGTVLYTATGV